jgi:hypothetical protein
LIAVARIEQLLHPASSRPGVVLFSDSHPSIVNRPSGNHWSVKHRCLPNDEGRMTNDELRMRKRGLFNDLLNPYDVDKESVGIGWWGLA